MLSVLVGAPEPACMTTADIDFWLLGFSPLSSARPITAAALA